MRACVYDRFGAPEVLRIADLAEPALTAGRVRVQVHAAALNPKDVLVRKGRMRWLTRAPFPRIPGYDLAGVLLDPAGDLPVGTPVFGMIQHHRGGACAEVALLHPGELARCPGALSYTEAASLPLAGLTALQALRDELGVRPGQTVLINGASGGVGTLAVQIAHALGAEVVAVCSGRNAAFVEQLGAARVLDYAVQDPAEQRGLDHVFDVYGNLGWSQGRTMLRAGGRFCTTVPRPGSVARGILRRVGLHRAALVVVKSRRDDLEQLARWVQSGTLSPVIDRVVRLEDSAEGHRHLETRRARGKVVVEVLPGTADEPRPRSGP